MSDRELPTHQYSDFDDLNAYYLAKGQASDQANIQADKTIKFRFS